MKIEHKLDLVWLAPFFLFIWGLISIYFFEHIPVNNGFGWDGRLYGNLAQNFEEILQSKSLEAYSVQRIFPSMVIYYFTDFLSIPHTVENVVSGFLIYTLVLITACGLLWVLIAKELKLSNYEMWLGYILLFLNYPVLKWFFYNPVSTDSTAFFLGMLMLYAGLKRYSIVLVLSLVITFFTWPAGIVTSILLILFPFRKLDVSFAKPNSTVLNNILPYIFIVLFTIILICVIYFTKLESGKGMVWYLNLLISSVLVIVFGYFVFIPFIRAIDYSNLLFESIKPHFIIKILVIGTLLIMLGWLKGNIYNDEVPANFDFTGLIVNIFTYSIELPFKFLVAHTVFWGPAFLLLILFFHEVFVRVFNSGFGIIFISLYFIFLGLDSESRILMNTYPFLIPFLLLSLRESLIKNKSYLLLFLILCSVLFSKLWVRINMANDYVVGNYDFPIQRYFMQHGPWMLPSVYIINIITILILGFILLKFFPAKFEKLKNTFWGLIRRNQ